MCVNPTINDGDRMTTYTAIKIKDPRAMGLGSGINPNSMWLAVPWGKEWYVKYSDYEFPVYLSDVDKGWVQIIDEIKGPVVLKR